MDTKKKSSVRSTFIISFITGDQCGDGHSHSEKEFFISNKNMTDVFVAYQKGVSITGVDLIKDYCSEYEETQLPCNVVNEIFKHSGEIELESDMEDDMYILTPYDWVILVTTIAKVGDPKLKLERLVSDGVIYAGGYGLFLD
jgi:hypothetical protein